MKILFVIAVIVASIAFAWFANWCAKKYLTDDENNNDNDDFLKGAF